MSHDRKKNKRVAPTLAHYAAKLTPGKAPTPPQADTAKLTPIRIRMEGEFWFWHSLAGVNRELVTRLARRLGIELSVAPIGPRQFGPEVDPRLSVIDELSFVKLSGPAHVKLRHFYPPRLNGPIEGLLVVMLAWEYGFLPTRWISDMLANVAEFWCYSEAIKQTYIASGIPPERIVVMPLGADPEIFRPDGPRYVFTTECGAHRLAAFDEPPFVLLCCGGALDRKGADVLEKAFLHTFAPGEPVVLVVKDFCSDTVYRGATAADRFRSLAADVTRPLVIYMDENLTPAGLAALYRAADVICAPYRAEGYCLPAIEAMSSGRAVIITTGAPGARAATDDFVDEEVGWLVRSERRSYGNRMIGELACCGETWWLEPDPKALGKAMREAYNNRDEVRKRGEAAAKRVREKYTWDHTVDKMVERLEALAEKGRRKTGGGGDGEKKRVGDEAQQTPAEANTAKQTPPEANTAQQTPTEANTAQQTPPKANTAQQTPPKANTAQQTPPKANTAQQTPILLTATDIIDRRSGAPATVIRPPAFRRKRPFICLCMIVRQGGLTLGACLQSVRDADCVDAICITDTGSTDYTVKIAKKYGAKISYFPWRDSFSLARNYNLDQAPKEADWLLWMDADDTIPIQCGAKLRESVLLAEARTMGILMQVHIPPRPGEYGYTVVDHLKLIRAGHPEFRFESRLHEQIMEPITRTGGYIERSAAYVVHSGYDYSPEGQLIKRLRDEKLLDLDELERPNHPMPKWNVAMTAFHHGEFQKAIEKLEECLALSQPQESTVHKCYAMMGGAYIEMGNRDKAREYLDLGLSMYPYDTELLFRSAGLYRDLGDYPAAERLYLRLLAPREASGIDSLDVTMGTYKGVFNLGSVYLAMQRYSDAERCYRSALQQCPPFVPAWQMLGNVYIRMRRFEDAREVQRKLAELSPEAAAALGREIAGAM